MSKSRNHHIVQQAWQKLFGCDKDRDKNGSSRQHYYCLEENRYIGLNSSKNFMSMNDLNSAIDHNLSIDDDLEKKISEYEKNNFPAIDAVVNKKKLKRDCLEPLCKYISLQAFRHPESFEGLPARGRSVALALADGIHCTSCYIEFKLYMKFLYSYVMNISEYEYYELKFRVELFSDAFWSEVEEISNSEYYFKEMNPIKYIETIDILNGDLLKKFNYELVVSKKPTFVQSDRPVPSERLVHGFSMSLGHSVALNVKPKKTNWPIWFTVNGTSEEVDRINREIVSRGVKHICGPSKQLVERYGHWLKKK